MVYDEVLEKIVPTYPYENYPDVSLGDFLSSELNHYLKAKQITIDRNEFNQKDKVIRWLNKQHPYLNMIGSEKLTDVSVQGKPIEKVMTLCTL